MKFAKKKGNVTRRPGLKKSSIKKKKRQQLGTSRMEKEQQKW